MGRPRRIAVTERLTTGRPEIGISRGPVHRAPRRAAPDLRAAVLAQQEGDRSRAVQCQDAMRTLGGEELREAGTMGRGLLERGGQLGPRRAKHPLARRKQARGGIEVLGGELDDSRHRSG